MTSVVKSVLASYLGDYFADFKDSMLKLFAYIFIHLFNFFLSSFSEIRFCSQNLHIKRTAFLKLCGLEVIHGVFGNFELTVPTSKNKALQMVISDVAIIFRPVGAEVSPPFSLILHSSAC